jgi:hypothetical protein
MFGPPRRGRMSLAVGETYGNGNPRIRFRPPREYVRPRTTMAGGRFLLGPENLLPSLLLVICPCFPTATFCSL